MWVLILFGLVTSPKGYCIERHGGCWDSPKQGDETYAPFAIARSKSDNVNSWARWQWQHRAVNDPKRDGRHLRMTRWYKTFPQEAQAGPTSFFKIRFPMRPARRMIACPIEMNPPCIRQSSRPIKPKSETTLALEIPPISPSASPSQAPHQWLLQPHPSLPWQGRRRHL